MKNLLLISSAVLFFACGTKTENQYENINLDNTEDKISFSIGADMASQMKNLPDSIFRLLDIPQLESGFAAGYENFTEEMNADCEKKMKSIIKRNMSIDTSEYSMADFSYCYGNFFGEATKKMLDDKNATNYFNLEMGRKGFACSLLDLDTTYIKQEERVKMVEDFYNDLTKKASEKLIDEAKSKDGVEIIADDVVLETVEPGNGEVLSEGLEYKMILIMQNTFGDTILATIKDFNLGDDVNSQVLQFSDKRLVDAWKEALPSMEIGGKYRIYAGEAKAFGDQGLRNPQTYGYFFQPFEAITVTTKVLTQNKIGELAKARGEKLMKEAANKPNTKKYPEGYIIETLEEGEGATVPAGSDVRAHYILYDSKLSELQNSYKMSAQAQQPAPSFNLGSVVKGWTLGVQNMKKGGRYRLYLPYDLAYGERGSDIIEPYETLMFEMEILEYGEGGSLQQPRRPSMGM